MTNRTCVVDGCERPTRRPGSPHCDTHYFRLYRTGSLDRTPTQQVCTVEGCDRKHKARGWCAAHYLAWRTHGTPTPARPASLDVGYSHAHRRVAKQRGPARTHQCGACRRPAAHWAYTHDCPDEQQGVEGPYSGDVARYEALCVPCHKRSDLARLRARPPAA